MASDQEQAFVVCKGRTIVGRRGTRVAGQVVTAREVGGPERLAALEAIGAVEKQGKKPEKLA